MSFDRIGLTVVLAVPPLLCCAGTSGRAPALARGESPWCIAAAGTVDSAFAVEQARHVLQSGSLPLKASAVQHVSGGLLVTLVPADAVTLGGGGLVWVNEQTGCPIVLIRDE